MVLQKFKTWFRLRATAFVLHKLDVDKIADYFVDYGEKHYLRGKKDFLEMIYIQLLLLTSAVNNRRRK